VDDRNLYKDVVTPEDASTMRDYLKSTYTNSPWTGWWSSTSTNCSIMHMRKGNKEFKYDIGAVTLRASEEKR